MNSSGGRGIDGKKAGTAASSVGIEARLGAGLRREPPRFDYEIIEEIDRRPLRPGEKERVIALIRGDGPEADEQTRCAAAFVAIKLGILDALPAMRDSLERGTSSEHVRGSFEFASMCLEIMKRNGQAPPESDQLLILLRMCGSGETVERMYGQLVVERAEIKYGTLVSW